MACSITGIENTGASLASPHTDRWAAAKHWDKDRSSTVNDIRHSAFMVGCM